MTTTRGEVDPQYEIMLSDMAEWSHWSASVYDGDGSKLEEHYAYYRKWSYSKLESEWEMGLDEVIESDQSNSGNITQHGVNLEEVQQIAGTILTKVSKQDG